MNANVDLGNEMYRDEADVAAMLQAMADRFSDLLTDAEQVEFASCPLDVGPEAVDRLAAAVTINDYCALVAAARPYLDRWLSAGIEYDDALTGRDYAGQYAAAICADKHLAGARLSRTVELLAA